MPVLRAGRLALSPRAALAVHRTLQRAHYSTPTSTLKISTVPAPSTGIIKIISLNRPSARNAISKQLLSELKTEIDALHAEHSSTSSSPETSTRALILTSESEACFCAGADLKERAGMSPEETATFLSTLRSTFQSLQDSPVPTISTIASSAFGGGLELALATHFRVFAAGATVALPETRLAIIPGAGGTWRLPALIGLGRARDLILTGRRVQGAEAYFLGLCDRLVEHEEGEDARQKVLDAALGLAGQICEGGPVAIKAAMQAIDNCALGQEAENAAYEKVLVTQDRLEALKAFREKRKPVFTGR